VLHLVIEIILIGIAQSCFVASNQLTRLYLDRIIYFSLLPAGELQNSPSIGYIILGEVRLFNTYGLACTFF
jgi:hypothetical protein